MKELWITLTTSLGGLKTPERRLLFTVLMLVIYVLWLSFRDSRTERIVRIEHLEQLHVEDVKATETLRILMQDKIDQCATERYDDLKHALEQATDLKNSIKPPGK